MAKEQEGARGPTTLLVPINVWRCEDLKALIQQHVRAHVKDVELATRLEHALGDQVAYGDGGGGNVGVA
jgi:hypothetical protein